MRLLAIALLALLLIGCGSPLTPLPDPVPGVELQPVKEAIGIRCNPQLGPEPEYPDTAEALRAAPNLFEKVKLLLAGRVLRIKRDLEKTAALDGCRNG